MRIELGTVLSNLVKSYNNFQNKFATVGNNFTMVPVYKNPNFGYGRRQSIKLDLIFFRGGLDGYTRAKHKRADMGQMHGIR